MIPNDLYIWKLICCVFLNKREVLSRFFEKSYIFQYFSTCQTRSDDFWILNAMCMFVYLFVVYFSFAPVISAITHLYCELFLYPSPDDGYYNRNVNVDFTSWYIHLFGLYFFLLPSHIYIYIYIYIYLIMHGIVHPRTCYQHLGCVGYLNHILVESN